LISNVSSLKVTQKPACVLALMDVVMITEMK